MIAPKFDGLMIMRTDEREYIRLQKKDWCVIVGVDGKNLKILFEGSLWWVSNLAMVVISSRVTF